MIKTPLLALALTVLLLGTAPEARAHPHGWIDLGVVVHFDQQGRVTALEQRWRMDPFYSLVVMEELAADASETSMEQRLDRLGLEIRDNLAAQQYFTELSHGGQPLALGDVENYSVRRRDDRLVFSFLLPLATPLAPGDMPLRYRIFDPSYYIEVVHEADDEGPRMDALTLRGAADDCAARIISADPDPARVAEAAQLDIDETAEPGLGRFFAETGEVTCQS
ncbi:DUF1007 family protein [Halomonas sp. YLGW01]|uniref:DUF1007 family protein n=1 Tax=Halomonas sp. YLGW01 TaxID=2773308 RepID=UPI001F5BF6B7|nr:DUF1007 family protein [Halomonas sp. YLGW01]